jgi:hypothetical protein
MVLLGGHLSGTYLSTFMLYFAEYCFRHVYLAI